MLIHVLNMFETYLYKKGNGISQRKVIDNVIQISGCQNDQEMNQREENSYSNKASIFDDYDG